MATIYGYANITDELTSMSLVYDGNAIYDSAWSQSAIHFQAQNSSSYANVGGMGGLTTVWLHWAQSPRNSWNGGGTIMTVYNPSGVPIFNVINNGTGAFAQYWNGTAFVSIGTPFLVSGSTVRFDLYIVINGASSTLQFYVAGVLQGSATFNGSNAAVAAGVDNFSVFAVDNFAGSQGSCQELVAVDSPTINYRYCTRSPNAVGSHQDWTGSSTISNVAKVGVNDSTSIQSPTAGQKTTYTPVSNSNVTGAQTVKEVRIIPRGRRDSTGPQNLKGMFVISSTDYLSANISPQPNFGFAGMTAPQLRFATNPATGIAWTPATAGGTLEFGVASVA